MLKRVLGVSLMVGMMALTGCAAEKQVKADDSEALAAAQRAEDAARRAEAAAKEAQAASEKSEVIFHKNLQK
jgi:hypothetical protein